MFMNHTLEHYPNFYLEFAQVGGVHMQPFKEPRLKITAMEM